MHRTKTIALRYAALVAGLLAGLGAQSAWAQGVKDEQNHETDLRETITLAGSGATLVGDGKRTRCHSAKSCPDATLYCWRGPQNEPAIHLTGAHTTVGDFGLVGRPVSGIRLKWRLSRIEFPLMIGPILQTVIDGHG